MSIPAWLYLLRPFLSPIFVVFDHCCWLLCCCWLPSRASLSSLLLSCFTQCYCEALRAQTRWGALEVLFIIIIINSLHTKDCTYSPIAYTLLYQGLHMWSALSKICSRSVTWFVRNKWSFLHSITIYQCKCTLSSAAVVVLGSLTAYSWTDQVPDLLAVNFSGKKGFFLLHCLDGYCYKQRQ